MSHTPLRVLARGTALLAATAALTLSVAASAEARPAARVQTGPLTVTNVKIVGTAGVNYTAVTPGTSITVTGNFAINEPDSTIDQFTIGWAGSSAPLGCLYSGGTHKGAFRFTLGAPPNPGLNQVAVDYGQDFSCNTAGWWGGASGPVVADVAVTASDSGSNGPASLSGVRISGVGENTSLQPNGAIRITGKYAWGPNTGDSFDQIQIGWSGSSAPAACIDAGSGPVSPTAFTALLGPAPSKGANYIVFEYAQLFGCSTSGWFAGDATSATPVGLVYNTHI